MSTTLQSLHAPLSAAPVRRIDRGDLNWALSEGWKDFQDKRGDVLFLALIYPVVGLAAALAVFNAKLLPLFFPLVAGLSIFGPAVAAGFYEIARRRELGLDSTWRHFFDPLRGASRGALAMLTAGLAILFTGWLLTAWAIYAATMGASEPAGVAEFLRRLLTTPEGWTLIVLGNLAGFDFAVLTLILAVVSFPMVVDKRVDAGTAIATSIHAVMRNPAAMASWGLRVAGLLVVGALPGFVGLAVVLPVLGYATWHLYTRVVER